MVQVDCTRDARKARMLERRAARTRRSKWLGRVIFSLTGFGLLALLRMHPDIIEDIVAYAHDVPARHETATLAAPETVVVRTMPNDTVPVRRAGTVQATQP